MEPPGGDESGAVLCGKVSSDTNVESGGVSSDIMAAVSNVKSIYCGLTPAA